MESEVENFDGEGECHRDLDMNIDRHKKMLFKKNETTHLTNFSVSFEESQVEIDSEKSQNTEKIKKTLFKKPKEASQRLADFSVSFEESQVESELEKSQNTEKIKKTLFKKHKEPSNLTDFSVNFEESQPESDLDKSQNSQKHKRTLFQKPEMSHLTNFSVNYEESQVESDLDKSLNSQETKKKLFKKLETPHIQDFSVNFEESQVESDLEKSNSIVKSKTIFNSKQRTLIDPFNDFSTHSNDSNSQSKSKKHKDAESETSTTNTSTVLKKKMNQSKSKSGVQSNEFNVDFEQTSSGGEQPTSASKKTIFKSKSSGKNDSFQVSYCESINNSINLSNNSAKKRRISLNQSKNVSFDKDQLFRNNKENIQTDHYDSVSENEGENSVEHSKSLETGNASNITGNISPRVNNNINTTENAKVGVSIKNLNKTPKRNCKNGLRDEELDENEEIQKSPIHEEIRKSFEGNYTFSPQENLNESVQKSSSNAMVERHVNENINSESYLDHSSFNDENLKYWMSDDSEEEILPPSIPRVSSNHLKDKINQSTKISQKELWEQVFSQAVLKAKKGKEELKKTNVFQKPNNKIVRNKTVTNVKKNIQPSDKCKEVNNTSRNRKPAYFANEKMYQYVEAKLKPKFGIDGKRKANDLIWNICDTVKFVTSKKHHQKKVLEKLKKEMFEAGLIETTVDFYEFVIKFLPYAFREKVVPCLNPVSNTVNPPRDPVDPFEKLVYSN